MYVRVVKAGQISCDSSSSQRRWDSVGYVLCKAVATAPTGGNAAGRLLTAIANLMIESAIESAMNIQV